VRLAGPFNHNGGAAYALSVPQIEYQADTAEEPRRSKVMLYEDGRMLGLAHAMHDHIVRFGKGRFSHYGANRISPPATIVTRTRMAARMLIARSFDSDGATQSEPLATTDPKP
jgi:hypothetical protein